MIRFCQCFFSLFFLLSSGVIHASSTLVGTTTGQFQVTPQGAGEYNIPIGVPSGIAGMEPELQFVHNGSTANGFMGVGWSLSGLSSLNRCNATLVEDSFIAEPQFNENDRFCRDGIKLVVAGDVGYGHAGSEYYSVVDGHDKILAYGQKDSGPEYFEVTTAAGRKLIYGNSSESRIEVPNKGVVTWLLSRVEDIFGNGRGKQ